MQQFGSAQKPQSAAARTMPCIRTPGIPVQFAADQTVSCEGPTVTRSRCDHPTHCLQTTKSLTSDNRPATSDNSKSPQDAAIRYEPAAAVNHTSKTKRHRFKLQTMLLTSRINRPPPQHQTKSHSTEKADTLLNTKQKGVAGNLHSDALILTFEFPASL